MKRRVLHKGEREGVEEEEKAGESVGVAEKKTKKQKKKKKKRKESNFAFLTAKANARGGVIPSTFLYFFLVGIR